MRLTKKISLTLVFLFIALAFTIQTSHSATQKTFILNWTDPIFRYEENALNDTNTTKHVIFSGNQNKTEYITIPKNSTIINASFSLTGKITPSQTYATGIELFYSVAVGNVTADDQNEIVIGAQNSLFLLNHSLAQIRNYSIGNIIRSVSIGNVTSDVGEEIVAGSDDNYIYLLNSTLDHIWNYSFNDGVKSVAIGNITSDTGNEVVAGGNNRKVTVLNSTKDVKWTYDTIDTVYSLVIGNVTSDSGNEIAVGDTNTIYLLNSTGNQTWNYNIGSNIYALAIGDISSDSGNEIAAGTNNGTVYVLNSSGIIKWKYDVNNTIYSVAIGDITSDTGNEIAVGSKDKKVYVLNSTGSFIWSYTASDYVYGVAVGDVNKNETTDPRNETIIVSRDKNVYVLNFQYFPTNVSIDIGNDGDYDWSYSQTTLREAVNVPNSSLAQGIQDYLNSCTSQNCNVSFVLHSDASGDLEVSNINITYDYNASEAINYSQINAWARTNNTLVNESIGNQTINISYYRNPVNTIQITYVNISSTATSCSFGGISYSNTTINGQNVCNLTNYRTINSIGSLPSFDILWDNSMSTGIPIYYNQSSSFNPSSGFWAKNITIWNVTSTIFYNVTANVSLDSSVISDQGLYVDWYSNGTFYDISPTNSANDCNTTNPSYTNKTINGTDDFFVCKQDTNGDGRIDFFKWKQSHTSTIIYTVNGSMNSPANLTNNLTIPTSGKWNLQSFNFSIDVNDTEGDNVTVKFWLKLDELEWQMIESKNITGNGTLQFNATSNKSWVSGSLYKFEYQDFNSTGYVYHNWQNTSDYPGPTILKHNVSFIYISGNNTNVNKTGTNTTFLSFIVNDTDLNQNVSNVNCSFWITTDGTNFILANTTLTNGTGHCNFNFDPGSSYYAGQQLWKGGTYQDSYYYDTNSTNYTVNVFGEVSINFTDSFINRNFIRGNNVTFLAKLLDENNNIASVSDYNCTWYVNGSQKANSTTNSSGYCNYTWSTGCSGSDVSSSLGIYTINVTLCGSVSSYYTTAINESHTNATLKDNLNVTIIRPISNQIIHEQENVTLNSTVSDSCGTPSGNYNVSWYYQRPDNRICNQTNPLTTGDNKTWLLPNVCYPQTLTITANATGNLYNSTNQSSVQVYLYGWASVDIKNPSSGDTINRTIYGETYNITCRVEDANMSLDINNYPVNFWFINSTAAYSIGTSLTDTNGNATYSWNISDSNVVQGEYTVKCSIVDNSTLKYNASVLEDNSTSVTIIASSDNTPPQILQVNATSAQQYIQNVTINANISDLYGVDKVWVNITFPNKVNYTYYLANTSSNNRRGIWNISLNLTDLGDYDFILYANDTNPNNTASSTTGWFEVYPSTIQFYGNMTDATSGNTSVEFIFYRNGTNSIIHTNSTTSTNAAYNFTIRKRNYDIEFRTFNHTIKLLDVNITSNTNNSISFDSIPQDKIPLTDGLRNRLVGMAIVNTLNFSSVNITLNFTDANKERPSRFSANDVDIYRCSNWNFTTRTCSNTPINLGGTPLPAANPKVVTIITQSLSAFFAGDTTNPNDNTCETGVESCSYDTTCCGGGGSSSSSGGGGGGGGAVITQCGNNICETGENRDNCPQDCGSPETLFSLRTNLTEVQMDLGEENTYLLWVTNNLNSNLNTSISILGTINNFVSLEKSTLTVGARKEETVKIYVKIPNDADPGTYTGQLSIIGNNKTQTIPVTIIVSLKGETYLDVVVKALDKKVGINETAKFYITLYDMGINKRFNANLGYLIKEYETDKIIYEENETKFIQSTQSFQKNIDLSHVNITAGRYWFEVRVKYGINSASQQDDFEVIKTFWTTKHINQAIVMILITTSTVSILYTRKRYIDWKLGKARYIFPLDFNKLPKGNFWLGKIAETSKRAFFDMSDLRTHVLTAGATGSGKSVSATIFVEELLKEKIPVIVFDPTAQWTGFVRPCRDPNLLKYYKEFGLNINDTRPYKGMIYEITDPNVNINFKKYMNPGEVTVFTLNKLKPGQYDIAVKNIIDTIFAQGWEESTKLKMVVVFDEVHRLLERYGGTGGYVALEKACREFRKWGIGLIMISQVLSDFKEAIKGNVLTEVQLHTKSLGDLSRIEKKYGLDYVKRVTKLEVGIGMMQNPKYNDGRPWFVAFRPTLHEPHKIPDIELETYKEYAALIEIIEANIEAIEKSGKDVFDLKTELKLAKDKLKNGRFRMAKIYIDSLRKHLNIGETNT